MSTCIFFFYFIEHIRFSSPIPDRPAQITLIDCQPGPSWQNGETTRIHDNYPSASRNIFTSSESEDDDIQVGVDWVPSPIQTTFNDDQSDLDLGSDVDLVAKKRTKRMTVREKEVYAIQTRVTIWNL